MALTLWAGAFGLRAQVAPDEPHNAQSNAVAPLRSEQPSARSTAGGLGAGVDFRIMGVLTPEQKLSLQSAIQARRSQAAQLEEKLRTARKQLLDVGLAGKFDENDIRQKAKAVGDAEAELAVFRARTLAEMKPPLTPEQISKMRGPLRLNLTNVSQMKTNAHPALLRSAPSALTPVSEPGKTP